MASAVFAGTSLVNMFVKDCWVNGIRRLIINRRGDEEEFFEIRTEWSDRDILYLHRSYSDLGRLFRRLLDSFPEDHGELSRSSLLEGLITIKDAHEIEARLNEVEKLLKTIINMPCKGICNRLKENSTPHIIKPESKRCIGACAVEAIFRFQTTAHVPKVMKIAEGKQEDLKITKEKKMAPVRLCNEG
ncbi:PX domain-containing protein 1 isoform X2 [Xenopus laevis]|uniref:PX domain-containing protein 1 isoform X2 n=1 Tax=Xenopus laevis TaxID=8355 RepID=A0A8J1L4U1_XENLA|nr:PX domain-containing protein 1 isoform X2 [Xenopus laevis]